MKPHLVKRNEQTHIEKRLTENMPKCYWIGQKRASGFPVQCDGKI